MNEELIKQFEPQPLQVLKVDQRQMLVVRFGAQGKRLLAGGFDGKVYRWDLSPADGPIEAPPLEEPKKKPPAPVGPELPALTPVLGHSGWVTGIACHPSQPIAYSVDSWGKLQAWNCLEEASKTLWEVAAAHDGWIQGLAISPAGDLLATCGNDGRVRVWQTADGKQLWDIAASQHEVFSLAFHPSELALVSGDLLGQIAQWDLQTGKQVRAFNAAVFYSLSRLQDVGGVRCLSFDPAGKTLVAGGTVPSGGGTVQGEPKALLFDWKTAKNEHTLVFGAKTECFLQEAILLPENVLLGVTAGTPGNGRLSFFAIGEDKPFFQAKGLTNCHSLALDPTGKRLAVVATGPNAGGNGRQLKDGEYVANHTPIHLLEFTR